MLPIVLLTIKITLLPNSTTLLTLRIDFWG